MTSVLSPLCWPIAWLLHEVHQCLSLGLNPDGSASWLLTLLLVVAAFRLALLPLAMSAARTRAQLRALEPRLAAVAREHVGDAKKVAAARVEVYRAEGVRPATWILVLAIQVPVFVAMALLLHHVVTDASAAYGLSTETIASLRQAPLAGAPLASSAHSSPADVAALGGSLFAVRLVAAGLAGTAVAATVVSMFLTLRRMPTAAHKSRIRLPLMGFSLFAVAAGMGALPVVMSFNVAVVVVLTLVQNEWLLRRYPMPPALES